MQSYALTRAEAEKIYRDHAVDVYRTALFLTRSEAMAEDVTQETMLRAFRKYTSYDPARPLRPWLYRITLNVARNALRRQKWLFFTARVPERPGRDFVEGAVLRIEEEAALWAAVDRLPVKSREVVVLHFHAGLTLAETAAVLGVPQGTCKSRLHAALAALKRRLQASDFAIVYKGENAYETI
jgi:RNA polymerase sigma-70 factor (ECF subfamily)